MAGHEGGNAIEIHVRTTVETSGFGISWQDKTVAFTDAHAVVVVPLHWGSAIIKRSPMPKRATPFFSPEINVGSAASSTSRQEPERATTNVDTAHLLQETANGSAAQPAEYFKRNRSSAAQPAPGKEEHFCKFAF